jgi:hypothetical protein
MSKVINAIVKVQRGWNGQLERINALCNMIIEAGLVTKKLEKRLHNVTNQYYRFYNDGDFPRLVNSYDDCSTEQALESELDTVLSLVMKFSTTAMRTKLRKQRQYGRIACMQTHLQNKDTHSIIPDPASIQSWGSNQGYWYNKLITVDHEAMPELRATMESALPLYNEINAFIEVNAPHLTNRVFTYVIKDFEEGAQSTISENFFILKARMDVILNKALGMVNAHIGTLPLPDYMLKTA